MCSSGAGAGERGRGYCRIRGYARGDSGVGGWYDPSGRLESEQRLFLSGQFAPVISKHGLLRFLG